MSSIDPSSRSEVASARESLIDRVGDACRRWSRSQFDVVVLAAELDDSDAWIAAGMASAAHLLADIADIEVSTAREWVRIGHKLRDLPVIAAALEERSISYSKARTLTRVATAANEDELLEIACRVPAGHLGRALAAWSNRNEDNTAIAARHHADRSVTKRVDPDGMVVTTTRLPPLASGQLHALLDVLVMSNQLTHGLPPTTTGDHDASADASPEHPSLAQQRADALVHLATNGGGSVDAEVVIHVRGDGNALDDGTPIPDSAVTDVIPTAFIRALIHDIEGRPIDASFRRRHPSARQKRVVHERDRACVDCSSAELGEYDHVPAWDETGRTVVNELQLRCAPCHRRRHTDRAA